MTSDRRAFEQGLSRLRGAREKETAARISFSRRAFERGLSVCTGDTPAYRHAFALFSVLPFVLRALQCGRQLRDATAAGSSGCTSAHLGHISAVARL